MYLPKTPGHPAPDVKQCAMSGPVHRATSVTAFHATSVTSHPAAGVTGRSLARGSDAGIEFLIIGVQKSGTTSLFEYVRHHPDVYMPPQKEIGFFSSDSCYARGWDWYASSVAPEQANGAVCGEASVAYMSGTPDGRPGTSASPVPVPLSPGDVPCEDNIPRRILRHLPGVKLICILRDPIARCLSHYHMAVLSGTETRSFEAAITEMLAPGALEAARRTITGSNGFIVRGEYHRLLSGFWRTFPPEQLLVVFSSDLDHRRAEVVQRVFEFIGVRSDFIPPNLHVRYRQAAVTRRVHGLDLYGWQSRLSQGRAPRSAWHALPPRARRSIDRWYERASFRLDMWNARRGDIGNIVPEDVRERLISHFRADNEALESALGVEVPWLAEWR